MKFTTSTITTGNEIVPWLAATGGLAYSPFTPPDKDYFFLYNFILPKIFNKCVNRKRHYWFGDYQGKDHFIVQSLLNFWGNAHNKNITPIFVQNAPATLENFEAPIAIFKFNCAALKQNEPHYLLIQHGSYLLIPIEEQPLLESGFVLLHRGIGKSNEYNVFQMPTDDFLLNRYRTDLSASFANSVTSFNTAHASVRKTETNHLLDSMDYFWLPSYSSPDIDDNFKKFLAIVNQCYTLKKDIAQYKFGPSYATFKTPVNNIRICTYFAGEYEARVLSLDHITPTNAIQCKFIQSSL